MQWSLRKKILAGYGIALLLMIVIVASSLANLLRLGKASEAILRENYRSILAADNMIGALERQDSAALLLILGYSDEGLAQFAGHETQFLLWLGRAKDNLTITGEREIVQTIEQEYSDYVLAWSHLRPLVPTESNRAIVFYHETMLPVFQRVRQACVRLREVNQETMFRASDRAAQIAHRAVASVLVIGAGAVCLSLTFSLLLSHLLVQPLRQLTAATQRLAAGDYHAHVSARSSDELGRLASDFNGMAEKLRAYKELDVHQILAEKHKSEAIIRSIDDGIVVIDGGLRITEINPTAAAACSTTATEANGKHVLEVIKNERLFEHIRQSIESGQTIPSAGGVENVVVLPKEETQRYYEFSLTLVKPAGQSVASVVLLLRDITRLKELDRLKSEFVMTASHELRTPLTSMEMSIELLGESATTKLDEKERQLLGAAREEVLRLKGLVNDLLHISKIEAGRMEMEFERTDVAVLFERAVAVLKNQAEEKGVEVTATAGSDLPPVRADANKITWVLTNLISNALRYTEAGGWIRLRARRTGSQVHLSVADNGEGIPYEYQSRIFDKFVQVKGQKSTGGSGLGLTICKEIIRAHGGTIWLDSTPGQGTTFTFTLPVVESRAQ